MSKFRHEWPLVYPMNKLPLTWKFIASPARAFYSALDEVPPHIVQVEHFSSTYTFKVSRYFRSTRHGINWCFDSIITNKCCHKLEYFVHRKGITLVIWFCVSPDWMAINLLFIHYHRKNSYVFSHWFYLVNEHSVKLTFYSCTVLWILTHI